MSRRILIVDDLATNRIILKVKLNAACHETIQASDGTSALKMARDEQPKLILLDLMLPDISGIEVCRRLRADPLTQHIPIVIITASADREKRLLALQAGADEFLVKPLNEVILLARIRSLLRTHELESELRMRSETWAEMELAERETVFTLPGRIGLIAAKPQTAIGWRQSLAPHLLDRITILSPTEALSDQADASEQDIYLIDADLGAYGSGLRLVADLRSRKQSRHSALALVLPEVEPNAAALALDMGATDLLPCPLEGQETALRISLHIQRKRRADQLRRAVHHGLKLAVTDPLTGLYNRRYGMSHLDRVAASSARSGRRFAVMLLDLDRFKTVNDVHGHAAGDAVLETVAARLRSSLHPKDMVARIGGEEFLVVLPETTMGAARQVAERLCRSVAGHPVRLDELSLEVSVTMSVGLALGPCLTDGPRDTSAETRQILARADAALLAAKSDGRNQVTIASAA
jgi:two-component system cell cycle response regulator